VAIAAAVLGAVGALAAADHQAAVAAKVAAAIGRADHPALAVVILAAMIWMMTCRFDQ
jgi:hypothetical protein